MSYDYDILSLGLLKYQTRSMDVLLEDQPSGCLANLNSSCPKRAVGRALLSMTQLNSGELPDRNVFCVAMIEDVYGALMEMLNSSVVRGAKTKTLGLLTFNVS